MSTVTVTYNYVYFASGPHTRQPRSSSGPGGFTLINSLSGGTLQTGDTFAAGAQPPTQTVHSGNIIGGSNQTCNFAFMSVSGGTPAGQTTPSAVNSSDSYAPPPPVTVGSAPITVLVVYVPVGGAGGGTGSGATIDSFDETTGALFDDTFVSVAPDPGSTLTTSGNVQGYVDTTNNETITALSPTAPTGVDFDRWVLLYPQATSHIGVGTGGVPTVVTTYPAGINVSGKALTVDKGTSVSALAFYKALPPAASSPCAECDETVAGINQMIAIGIPGPRFTTAEWTNVEATLQKCIAQKCLTQAAVSALIAAYLKYASGANQPPAGSGLPRP